MNKVIFLDVDGVLNIFSETYKTNSVDYDNLIHNEEDKIPFFGTRVNCSSGLSDENAKFIIKYLNEN